MKNLYPQSGAVVVGRSQVAAIVNPIIGSPASETVLGRLVISGGTISTGLVNDIAVGGISINGTSHPVKMDFFAPDTRLDGQDFLGLPVKQRADIVISHSANVDFAVAWNCDPVTPDMQPIGDVRDYPSRIPLYWGIQPVTVNASGTASSVTQVQKPGTLGPLLMGITGAAGMNLHDLIVTSITINGIPVLNGAAGAEGVTVAHYDPRADDVDGRTEPVYVETNDIIQVDYKNLDAVNAATVYGMFYALPVVV